MLTALAAVILCGLMLVPVANIAVGLIAGAALGGVGGAVLGIIVGLVVTGYALSYATANPFRF